MSARKLLLVTYHFPPSAAVAAHRMIGLVRYLPFHGWETVVVAPPGVPGEPVDENLLLQVPVQTIVRTVPFQRGFMGKVAGRFLPLGRWLPPALRACRQVIAEHRPDAIYTSSPPGCVHYLGLYLKRRYGLPWFACLRDPWITNRRSDVPMPRWQRLEIPWEVRVMRHADAIIANTPLSLAGLQSAFPRQSHKMACVTNGFDPECFGPTPVRDRLDNRLTILHAGELYSGRDPRPFLDALRLLEDQPNGASDRPHFRVSFLGRSTEAIYDLPHEISGRSLDGIVEMQEHAPYAGAIEQMLASDILLLIHSPRSRLGIPAKLFEYLGARRPILALAEDDGDVAWVLRESGVPHRIAPPNDAGRIRRALAELGGEILRGVVSPGDPTRLERFTRQHMAASLARRFDAAITNLPTAGLRGAY